MSPPAAPKASTPKPKPPVIGYTAKYDYNPANSAYGGRYGSVVAKPARKVPKAPPKPQSTGYTPKYGADTSSGYGGRFGEFQEKLVARKSKGSSGRSSGLRNSQSTSDTGSSRSFSDTNSLRVAAPSVLDTYSLLRVDTMPASILYAEADPVEDTKPILLAGTNTALESLSPSVGLNTAFETDNGSAMFTGTKSAQGEPPIGPGLLPGSKSVSESLTLSVGSNTASETSKGSALLAGTKSEQGESDTEVALLAGTKSAPESLPTSVYSMAARDSDGESVDTLVRQIDFAISGLGVNSEVLGRGEKAQCGRKASAPAPRPRGMRTDYLKVLWDSERKRNARPTPSLASIPSVETNVLNIRDSVAVSFVPYHSERTLVRSPSISSVGTSILDQDMDFCIPTLTEQIGVATTTGSADQYAPKRIEPAFMAFQDTVGPAAVEQPAKGWPFPEESDVEPAIAELSLVLDTSPLLGEAPARPLERWLRRLKGRRGTVGEQQQTAKQDRWKLLTRGSK